ncbi:bifunctional ornithine acetyltransferase/N-acetylglutamate synthase, partial [bacterium]|nr:bifunctional ornithine acetyltransferase/N-acetylglutamate synthase [bacterium]
SASDLVVCSTGLIGERLPMDLLLAGAADAVAELAAEGGPNAALAIMTTDTKPKMATSEFGEVRIGGMAKGAGMLAPSLATMLVVITTDALLDTTQLDAQAAFTAAMALLNTKLSSHST